MSKEMIRDLIDYSLDSKNVYDPTKFVQSRRVQGQIDNAEFQFSYSYLLGNAYWTGLLGKEASPFTMTLVRNSGFHLVIGDEEFAHHFHATPDQNGGFQILQEILSYIN